MKTIIITCVLSFVSMVALAQAPQKISYQAVARDAGGNMLPMQNIGVKFILYQGSIGGTISYAETHAVTTNSFGLFSVFIGGGSPTAGNFSAIIWANGPYFVETLIDPAGGTSYSSIGTQQLMSVPYALYAEKSGNAIAPTFTINSPNTVLSNTATSSYTLNVPTYSAGPGISITSGVITNTAAASPPTIAGTGVASVTPSGNTFTVSVPPATYTYNANTGVLAVSQGTTTSTTSIIPELSLSGNTLYSAVPSNSVNLSNLTGLWSVNGNSVFPTNPSHYIGIGTTAPNNIFQVKDYINFENNGSNTSLGYLTGTGTSPNNYWNTFIGFKAGQVVGTATGSATANTFVGYNAGSLNLNGYNNLFLGAKTGVNNTNGSNNSFLGTESGFNNTNGANNTFIGYGADLSSAIQHTNATAIGYNAKVDADNAMVLGDGTVNVGIGVTSPLYKLEINEPSIAKPALVASNSASSSSSLAVGIYGTCNSTSTLSAGIKGGNGGSGVAVLGLKPAGTLDGNAGRFEILGTTNSSDGLFAKTNGIGSAVKAVCGPTVSGSSNVALEVEDGHFKTTSTSASPTFSILTASTSFTYIGNNGTDVAGEMNIVVSATTKTSNTSYVRITFRKPYVVKPIVVLTPTTFVAATVAPYVTVTTTDFTVWFANSISPLIVTNYSFNYFVIEGK